jgi:hypothetical protein
MKLKQLLNEDVLAILSEESIEAIETAFTTKMTVAVETALSQQDESYAAKLENLLEAIDKDCTRKLKKVVESIDKSSTIKLKRVIKKYESILNEDANKFKKQMVRGISQYIDEYIDSAIPIESLNEAVRNTSATRVLSNLRSALAVDSALMKESVKVALVDGKQTMDAQALQIAELTKQVKQLNESKQKAEAALLLERKTAGMPASRKKHILKTLGDKSPAWINENFEYTKTLIIKNERSQEAELKNEAFQQRTIKSDTVVSESTNQPNQKTPMSGYISELQKYK